MKLEIDDTVIAAAIKCEKQCSCLSQPETLCKVTHCVSGLVHFIECAVDKQCRYKTMFANEWFCACPVRKEIYNRYQA